MGKPDYQGGSLLNLMTTLGEALGLSTGPYQPLYPACGLKHDDLAQARQIVLLVIDGLGDELLLRLAPHSLLARRRLGSLTSVFPSTTASAIPTFLTGLPPQAHALTGWHMWFDELGETLSVLPLVPRSGTPEGWNEAALPPRLFDAPPLSQRIAEMNGGRCWMISPFNIVDSPFSRFFSRGAQTIGYQGTAGLFTAIEQAVLQAANAPSVRPAYIHAYYPVLDSLMHTLGTRHAKIAEHLARLDQALAACIQRLAGSGTTFVVTADHGFIDAPKERLIELGDHPALSGLLSRPLCGERRVAYAYVEESKRPAFAAYVDKHLGHACTLIRTTDFIAQGWFGPGPAHPQLASRAGDYVMLMKDDWTIKDWLPDEKPYDHAGVHAGSSLQEMLVPLIVAAD